MTKLKILHINTLDSQGGASQVAIDLIQHLDNECHMVVMKKAFGNPKVIELKRNTIDSIFTFLDKLFWKLGRPISLRAFLSLDNEFNRTYSKLKKLKEYREADVIHLHNLHGGYFDLKTLQRIATEKKIVWTLHDMWAITGGEAYTFENENYKKGIGYTPYISHYPLLNPIADRRQYFLERKKRIYEQIHDAITIVPVSKWLDRCFREAFVYNPSIMLRMIHNGIDTTIFKNRQLRNWSKLRILFFNFDNPFKGGHLFTGILDRIEREFDLFVIGESLDQDVPYTHLQYIHNRETLSEVYNQTDILIFPSLAENFPLTVLEAMACGVCVIGSDTGGIPEMLNNDCGFLFKKDNREDLLEKINFALHDKDVITRKGKLAEQLVHEHFTLKKNCKVYEALYREILTYSNWSTDGETKNTDQKAAKVSDFFK